VTPVRRLFWEGAINSESEAARHMGAVRQIRGHGFDSAHLDPLNLEVIGEKA
jgi:hypothetical protein